MINIIYKGVGIMKCKEEKHIINQDSVELNKNTRGFTYTIKVHGNKEEVLRKLDEFQKEVQQRINALQISSELER